MHLNPRLSVFLNLLSFATQKGVQSVIASSQVAANMAQLHALEQRSAYAQNHLHSEDQIPALTEEKPHFTTPLRHPTEPIREGQRAHFEAKLEPITDPHLQVEWFKDGQPVIIGHRFRPLHDFGYVALDIMDTISDDSGVYTCRATNLAGSCEIQARLICHSKKSPCLSHRGKSLIFLQIFEFLR